MPERLSLPIHHYRLQDSLNRTTGFWKNPFDSVQVNKNLNYNWIKYCLN